MKQFITLSIFFCSILAVSLVPEKAKGQQVDSLMKKIENFGDYLLYRNQDTNYISNYGNEVAVKLVSVNKYN
ncbi:MAG: hypothetical protein K8R74_09700, partial [Bacteroidales bacterium]|nr:hypothetical protein [Bacteroidales bacterium]